VYLLRDGRDVLVSYWHYREALDGVDYDFLTFVSEIFLYPCPWEQHVSAWLDNPFGAQVLVIRFEDLIHEPVRELKRFCDFAGISRDTGHLIGSAEAASFQNSRNRELRMGHGWPDYPFPRDKSFFRRGEVGSYKEEMPHEVLEKFLADAGETMRRCGYLAGCEVNRGTGAESPTVTATDPVAQLHAHHYWSYLIADHYCYSPASGCCWGHAVRSNTEGRSLRLDFPSWPSALRISC
jgi:hypothetical protein